MPVWIGLCLLLCWDLLQWQTCEGLQLALEHLELLELQEVLLYICLPLLDDLLDLLQLPDLWDLPLGSLHLLGVFTGCLFLQGLLHRAVKCPVL